MTIKKLFASLLVGAFVLSVSGAVFAAERKPALRAFGGIHQGSDDGTGNLEAQNAKLISGASKVITGVQINASGTACTVSLYDTASESGASAANGIFENSAVANTGDTVVFDPPLRAKNGIMMVTDGNEDGVVIFTQQAP